MNRGIYLELEGVDCAGKSTQARMLAERLTAEGHRVHLSAQPTSDTPIGKLIRAALRGDASFRDRLTLPLLFAADRQEYSHEIRGKLAEGCVVIGDRGALSTWAYATAAARAAGDPYAHGVSVWSDTLSEFAVQPALVLVLTMPAEECARRLAARGQKQELFEADAVLRHAATCYAEAASSRLWRVVQNIAAIGTVDEVHARVIRVVRALLDLHGRVRP